MPIAQRFDHVSLALRSITGALPVYRDLLGGVYEQSGEDERPGRAFRWYVLRMPGGVRVELMEPAGPQSFLHAFLNRRGEGVHHLTYQVESLEGAIEEMRARGYEPILVDGSNPAWREAYLHPRSAHGVLIQIYESNLSDEEMVARSQTEWGPRL